MTDEITRVPIKRIKRVVNAGSYNEVEAALLVETDTGEYLDLVFSFKLTPILNAGISAAGRYVYGKLDNPDQAIKIEWPSIGVRTAKAYATEEGHFEIATMFYSGPELCFELPGEALPPLLADLLELREEQLK